MNLSEVRACVAKDPYAMFLGIEVQEVSAEQATVTVPLKKEYNNSFGQAHGGLIFSLIDMTFASLGAANDVLCVNAQSSVSYINAGKGDQLRGVATRVRKGRKLFVCEVHVYDSENNVVAVSTVNGFVINPDKNR